MSELPLNPGALDGVRVIELTHAIAGPQCGQILADHGADVIKVEPTSGEISRDSLPRIGKDSVYFACHNRGKRSMVLDLKSGAGLATLHSLVGTADVVLTNYAGDVPERNGWGYGALADINPEIIMVHITGFGTTGPDRDVRALDGIIQAMSGIPEHTGTPESGPILVAAFVADHIAAYHAALGTLLALQRRLKTRRGEFVDINMLRGYTAVSAHAIGAAYNGEPLGRGGNKVMTALCNTFSASDGLVVIAAIGELEWSNLCAAIGRDDWVAQLPYPIAVTTAREDVEKQVNDWCSWRTRAEVVEVMRAARVPSAPVFTIDERRLHAQRSGSDDIVEVTGPHGARIPVPGPVPKVGLSDSPGRWKVPALGAHTQEILDELARYG